MSRPEIKFFLKAKATDAKAAFIDICAAWRNDNGMLGARFDKRIAAIKLDDGTVLKVDAKGMVEGFFFNARTESEAPAKPGYTKAPPVTRGAPRGQSQDMPADDFDDDSIPF